MEDERTLTVLVVPDRGRDTRTIRLSYRALRRLTALAVALVLLAGALLASWGFLAARSWRASQLEAEVAHLRAEREQVAALAETLAEVEAAYERMRGLFGPDALPGDATEEWLPPPAGRPATPRAAEEGGTTPDTWPLTVRGFLTQPLLEGAGHDHPGIDIAVALGSYIRAAGPGEVVIAGEDPVYGLHLVIDHGDGYRTLYAHASRLLVETGDGVRRGEVVGLTGSTGQSTAPHLHFEVHLDGSPVDPLTLVRQP
jgi:murein DD-endopeptidase MepM/ murein hydrolase activator NlpD